MGPTMGSDTSSDDREVAEGCMWTCPTSPPCDSCRSCARGISAPTTPCSAMCRLLQAGQVVIAVSSNVQGHGAREFHTLGEACLRRSPHMSRQHLHSRCAAAPPTHCSARHQALQGLIIAHSVRASQPLKPRAPAPTFPLQDLPGLRPPVYPALHAQPQYT